MKQGYTEINGKFYQECEVVMLPTEKASVISLDMGENKLDYAPNFGFNFFNRKNNFQHNPQHLYFLSNEEIKNHEKTWVFNLSTKRIYQVNPVDTKRENEKVIIATTDNNISINLGKEYHVSPTAGGQMYARLSPFPRPTNSFIEKYVSEDNGGKQIKSVLVEMEFITTNEDWSKRPVQLNGYYKIKTAPDNTITIKPLVVKNSWSREEVISLINKYETDMVYYGRDSYYEKELPEAINNWIKNNL